MDKRRRAVLSRHTLLQRDYFRSMRKMSPRVRLAARLYASGQAATMQEAGKAAGIHPRYLPILVNNSPLVGDFIEDMTQAIDAQAIDIGARIKQLGRNAIEQINTMMVNGGSEQIKLKAAIDLADRSPETAKTQKHQIESFTLGDDSAKLLAQAIMDGRKAHKAFEGEVAGNFDRIPRIGAPHVVIPEEVPVQDSPRNADSAGTGAAS